ncbi:NUDIX domain-containing protein [Natrialbaceae archaeon A-chndr2]|uniref:NUDIX domain-containing protein n=1 Tax=Natronosalvus hydrolyticus TaxID=2979988 RepID=A0AAP2Z7K7_9EURY|nr:NUDIX domain-containing protein [Halobacteria archaeon AArc-curdl1]
MAQTQGTYVQKACAYLTRPNGDFLAFESPEHEGWQIPKGTIEGAETPREAVFREIVEESGIGSIGPTTHLVSDVWRRRCSPLKHYVRHFYHAVVYDSRDEFTHTVTGTGEEVGLEFEYQWIDPKMASRRQFALDLDDYLYLLADGTTPSSAMETTRASD